MTDAPLYTLRDIARDLDLPESTVRYYRDAFAHHIPTVGSGRRRRYPSEAVATLRLVALWYSEGKSREEIERELTDTPPTEIHEPRARAQYRPDPQPSDTAAYEEMLATVLDGERERREAMWQMAREVVRLGEALERQHTVLGDIAERVSAMSGRALPPGAPTQEIPLPPPPPSAAPGAAPPSPQEPPAAQAVAAAPSAAAEGAHAAQELMSELDSLRQELASEQALVERLRRSKLEIERRAAEAEARVSVRPSREMKRSVLSRLLSRDEGFTE